MLRPRSVAQVYDHNRLVEEDNTRGGCFVYCPTVDDGPSLSKLENCLNAEIDSVQCDPFGFYSAADQVELAREQAKDTGFCQACLADIAGTVEPSTTDEENLVSETTTAEPSTTDSETFVSETTSGTTAKNTKSPNTASTTPAPSRTGASATTASIAKATSTNAAIGVYKADIVPWKIGFAMGAMLFTSAVAGMLV
ncbi:hypothetical protein N5P37_005550 [Trichoderma harzianum]|uniref:Uncharacterized protein n=1 Tax=Trichoderma harzianum CBS 226.95 TaxID=983964 RepID=A0A2T4ABJ4_TRIHA|nr:hypothetical protein M431DRAFT_5131 [Trichoderma harzianum CBS 226.95]KAK0762732.1 hypothetical protein N5P37_005550 [Trichoderma harzianum]PKK54436.1 hypothetical protein CI102_916 [Trichoderma harzianum]PTB54451.1 hypothetical protein M431DRAFT_5131 [Trichoderma harzianum CBS 226.95]